MFARPQTIDEAVSLLRASPWTIVAGGTDFYPGLRDRAVSCLAPGFGLVRIILFVAIIVLHSITITVL